MGLVVCVEHGNGFMFVCPHVAEAVLSAHPCLGIEFREYEDPPEVIVGCWFCPACIKVNNLPPTGERVSDEFLNRTSELYRPMCPGCFRKWCDS